MPIFARAVFDFEGSQSDDLSFKEDDIIEIIDKDDSGWWTGKMGDRQGDFPFNYVELLDEAATKAHLAKIGGGTSASANDNIKDQEMEFQGDQVDTMKILGTEQGKQGTQHIIESSTTDGKLEKSKKTVASFRLLDGQLRTLIPDFEGKLPPQWADRAVLSESSLKARKEALEDYVQKLVASHGADFLLVPWLFPGQGIKLSADNFEKAKQAQELANAALKNKPPEAPPTLARVLYTWDPQDRVELHMVDGDVIAVLNRSTGSNGWWEGQSADGSRGLFPSNHVEIMDPADALAWMNGDASKAASVQFAAGTKSATVAAPAEKTKKKEKKPLAEKVKNTKVIPNFALGSTQAFDDLIDRGFCIEGPGGAPFTKPTGALPTAGDVVKLSFVTYVWDSQAQAVAEILSSEDHDEGPMEFTIDEDDPAIIKGIQAAVKQMTKGLSIRLTVAPHMGYGAVGVPPLIPPMSHLVYDLKLDDFGAPGKPRRTSILQTVFSKAPKPDVEPRNRGSIRLMQPVVNRGETATQQQVIGDHEGTTTKQPARRAGHIVLDSSAKTAASGAGAALAAAYSAAPAAPKAAPVQQKKYEYAALKKMIADGVNLNQLGIDRGNLEDYLDDKGFEEAFQMDKTQFLLKPKWRQVAAKRNAGLF